MSVPRFYEEELPEKEGRLKSESYRHLKALRLKKGDEVVLFDGKGNECYGFLEEIGSNEAVVNVKSRAKLPEKDVSITVACCLPKGKRQAFLVEKLAELGVARLIPLVASRTIVRPRGVERLGKIAVEAACQSGNSWIMAVDEPTDFRKAVEFEGYDLKIIAAPEGNPLKEALKDAKSRRILCLIGPEGGFTAEDVNSAEENGFCKASLGRALLRIETAAVMIASAINYEYGL